MVNEGEKLYPLLKEFDELSSKSMSFWLERFVLEVRKESGEFYPPNSLYSLCCGLQRTIKGNGINIFTDPIFAKFRQLLDSHMKKLKSTGTYERKCADIIPEESEDLLWDLKLLGDDNPQSLLDTVFFYIGLYFALRGGRRTSSITLFALPNSDIRTTECSQLHCIYRRCF